MYLNVSHCVWVQVTHRNPFFNSVINCSGAIEFFKLKLWRHRDEAISRRKRIRRVEPATDAFPDFGAGSYFAYLMKRSVRDFEEIEIVSTRQPLFMNFNWLALLVGNITIKEAAIFLDPVVTEKSSGKGFVNSFL